MWSCWWCMYVEELLYLVRRELKIFFGLVSLVWSKKKECGWIWCIVRVCCVWVCVCVKPQERNKEARAIMATKGTGGRNKGHKRTRGIAELVLEREEGRPCWKCIERPGIGLRPCTCIPRPYTCQTHKSKQTNKEWKQPQNERGINY
jgi:hypothetical protein